MKLLQKHDNGFYLSDEHLSEYLYVSSYDAKFAVSELDVGGNAVQITSTRSCLEPGGPLSSRHLKIVGSKGTATSFLALGFHIKSRGKHVSQATFYDAADEMGEEEADEVAALIDGYPLRQLFAKKSLFVVSAWEANETSTAAAIIAAVSGTMGGPVVAIDCAPRFYADPPRPEDPASDHDAYRAALAISVSEAQKVADAVIASSGSAILFAKQMSRSFDEQMLALVRRTGL